MAFGAAAAMGAFASVPEDCLNKASSWLEHKDLLTQRAVSARARDAARRATLALARGALVESKAVSRVCHVIFPQRSGEDEPWAQPRETAVTPQHVEAMGRVFGESCVYLACFSLCGTFHLPHPNAPNLQALI